MTIWQSALEKLAPISWKTLATCHTPKPRFQVPIPYRTLPLLAQFHSMSPSQSTLPWQPWLLSAFALALSLCPPVRPSAGLSAFKLAKGLRFEWVFRFDWSHAKNSRCRFCFINAKMMIFSLFLVGKQIDVAAFKVLVTTVIYNECNETYNNIS